MAQTVLITGGSSGLGKELAVQLSAKGYKVFGTSRKPSIEELPFDMLVLNVCDEASVKTAVKELLEKEGKIDILINNAGIGIAGPIEQIGLGNVQKAFDTNLYGTIRVCQAVMPHMRKAGIGKIINISSIGAAFGLPYRGIYCATKSSIDLITETIRMEAGKFGIECCSIRAGDMKTNISASRLQDIDMNDPTYAESYKKVYEMIDEDVDKGMPVEEAARQIVQIIQKDRFKRTYLVGKPLQKLSVIAKRVLPTRVFERIIMSYSNM